MRIFDISQELFGCVVFPGDPKPKREAISSMEEAPCRSILMALKGES